MYIHKLYPPHMWYKHLASILAASGSLTKLAFLQNLRLRECSPKQNWRHRPWSKGPGPATYKIKHNVVRGRPWGPWLQQSLCFGCCGFCPCFWGRSHPWFFARSHRAKNLPRSNHKISRPTTAMTGETSSPAMVCSPKVQGWFLRFFPAPWKVQGTPGELKRILEPEFNQMVQLFQEFEIMKACEVQLVSY